MKLIKIFVVFFCLLGTAFAEAPKFIAQGVYAYPDRIIIGDSEEVREKDWPVFFEEMSEFFDGLEVRVWGTSYLPSYDPSLLIRFIKKAHEYGVGVAINFWEYPNSRNMPLQYQAKKLDRDGKIVPTELSDDYAFNPLLDKCNAAAVKWQAEQIKAFLQMIVKEEPIDYFMFTEDRLSAWDAKTPWPHQVNYWQGGTYSKAAASSWGKYSQGHKLPVDNQKLVNQYTEYTDEESELWYKFWEWRFRIFANYINEILKAAHGVAAPVSQSFETIIMEWQRVYDEGIFSVNGDWPIADNAVFGVSAFWLSKMPYLDHFIVEYGEDGINNAAWQKANKKGTDQIASVVKGNNKAIGGFIQAYSWPLHKATPQMIEGEYNMSLEAGAKVIVVYDCAVLYSGNSRYSEEAVAEWQRVIPPKESIKPNGEIEAPPEFEEGDEEEEIVEE